MLYISDLISYFLMVRNFYFLVLLTTTEFKVNTVW